MNVPSVSLLQDSQFDLCSSVLSRAFFNDPTMVHCLPDDEMRAQVLPWFFSKMTALVHRQGIIFTTEKEVQGNALWLTPKKTDIGFLELARAGLLVGPIKYGLNPFIRFIKALNKFDEIHHKHMRMPHWYLFFLGVDPKSQGQGLGSALIKPILHQACQNNIPCYLETTQPRNVPYYEKNGFHVVAESVLFDHGPRFWAMSTRL